LHAAPVQPTAPLHALLPVQQIVPQLFYDGQSPPQPAVFQMFFQQPSTAFITLDTTVVVPDGGTVLMGGLKTLVEGRNEFGPPRADKTCKADYFSCTQSKVRPAHATLRIEPLHFQYALAWTVTEATAIGGIHFASHHEPHQFVHRRFGRSK